MALEHGTTEMAPALQQWSGAQIVETHDNNINAVGAVHGMHTWPPRYGQALIVYLRGKKVLRGSSP